MKLLTPRGIGSLSGLRERAGDEGPTLTPTLSRTPRRSLRQRVPQSGLAQGSAGPARRPLAAPACRMAREGGRSLRLLRRSGFMRL